MALSSFGVPTREQRLIVREVNNFDELAKRRLELQLKAFRHKKEQEEEPQDVFARLRN